MHRVWFSWGSGDAATPPEMFEFGTEKELNAFLAGVNAAVGNLWHTQLDNEQEVKDFNEKHGIDDE